MMNVRVLGTDGGIAEGCRTSCFLVDNDILIDAGTGLGDLDIDTMASIDNIFLSHIHMDHIAALPLMTDTVFSRRQSPITVHAPEGEHEHLTDHIFNGIIWPDFREIPTPENPIIRFQALSDEPYEINGRRIGTLPANHHGEAVGFWLSNENGALVFTGDTGPCPQFWQAVNEIPDLRYVIIECSFPSSMGDLAIKTGHLTPALLASELAQLNGHPAVFATHMKPFAKADIIKEIAALSTPFDIGVLERDQVITL